MNDYPLEKSAMRRKPFGHGILCTLLVLSIALGLPVPLRAQSRPAQLTIPIGVCLPLSGKDDTGQRQRRALLMAQRIRPMAGDKAVELIFKDTRATPEGTRNAVRSALEDHDVAALIGGADPEEAAAMIDVMSQNRRLRANPIPVALTAADAPLTDAPYQPWRIGASLGDKARGAAVFTVGRLKARRAGILVDPGDAEGVRLASLFSSALIAQGGVVAEIAYLGKSESACRTALTVLANKRVEVIFLPDAGRAPQIILYSRAHGVKTPFLLADVRREGDFIKAVGASDGVYLVTDYHPAHVVGDHARRFLELYRTAYGEPDAIAALSADAYFLLCDTLPCWRAGKGRNPRSLSNTCTGNGYLSGKMDIAPTGTVVRNVYVCVIHASRLKCLEAIRP